MNDWFDCLNVRVPYQDSRKRTHGFGLDPIHFEIIKKMTATMTSLRVGEKRKSMMVFQKGNDLCLFYRIVHIAILISQY